ncbi:MAG: hypothetical protein L0K86_11715 [Actinomycetia bacterium]|nr:hypothetical protein [Actinomycetes bacterium]
MSETYKRVGGVLAALLAMALLLGAATIVLLATPSFADEDTGPGSVACAQANAKVLTAAVAASAKADEIAAGQDQVIAALKDAVELAQAAYDAVYAAYTADPPTATLAELQAAQTVLDGALKGLADAPGVPADQKQELADLQGKLEAAIEASVTACAPDVTPTATPAPTTTAPAAPADDDGSPKLPTAIDTGRA